MLRSCLALQSGANLTQEIFGLRAGFLCDVLRFGAGGLGDALGGINAFVPYLRCLFLRRRRCRRLWLSTGSGGGTEEGAPVNGSGAVEDKTTASTGELSAALF